MGRNASAVLVDHIAGGAADARDRLAPAAAAIGPQLARAGAKGREVVTADVLPRVADGLRAGRVAAEPVALEATRRGRAAFAALAAAPPKKTHKVRTTLLLGAAVGAGVAAWKAWKLPHASDDWTHADTYNAQKDAPKTDDKAAASTTVGS